MGTITIALRINRQPIRYLATAASRSKRRGKKVRTKKRQFESQLVEKKRNRRQAEMMYIAINGFGLNFPTS